jgi:hypothetical protein
MYIGSVVVLVPGKKIISAPRKHCSNRSRHGSQPFNQKKITSEKLSEAIPNAYQPKKHKRL